MPSNGLLIRWSLVRFQPGEPYKSLTCARRVRANSEKRDAECELLIDA